LKKGEQTNTFGGNPLACAAGLATLDYIVKHDLPTMAQQKGETYVSGLRRIVQDHKLGREVRGMGLMLALELRVDIQNILMESIKKGVIFTYSGRNVIRLLPPLIIGDDLIRRSLNVLETVISAEEKKYG
jgi:acetylornithine/LysW-gamma-L-lysine aminotransferase